MKLKLSILLLLCCGFMSLKAQTTITGTVTDDLNQTLPGVNILVKGTNRGVTSDFDGNYSIEVSKGEILQFSYIGFVAQDILIGDQEVLNVILKGDSQQLSEVVVIGYGTTSKKDLVSSVSSVKSDVLENQPVARLDQALQGRATGVSVTSNSGDPGSGSTIRIRGASSINGNNSPLYVVDGFIVGTGFNLNTLNVNDIKSVEVLKDATALSIYGTRGASGVILVTTKNGTEVSKGKPKISLNHYYSVQEVANEIDIVNGEDYVNYINEAGQFNPNLNNGFGGTDPNLPLLYEDPGAVETTDWLDLVTQTGHVMNTDLSIMGNSENSNYYISMNHFDQDGILRGSGLERITFRTNLDVRLSDKFKMGVRLNATHYKKENNKVNYSNIVQSVLPIKTVYDDEGNYTGTNPIKGTTERNPEADINLRVDHDIITKLITNAYFEYELFENFKLKSTIGAEITHTKYNDYLPGALPERILNNSGTGYGKVATNFSKSILNENTFTYDVNTDEDHSLKLLGGFTWQKDNNESTVSEADGFPNDAVSFNNLAFGDADLYYASSGYSQRTLASFLSRVDYGYKSKYLLTVVGRYDGSSVFETGKKYAFFPSVGVAWNTSDESFMEDIDVINKLKVRGSYGIVGEQGVSPYNSIATYSNGINVFNDNVVNAVLLGSVPSDGLKWETTKQLDLGFEVSLLDNRIMFEVDYYKKTTEDLLLAKALSAQAGGGTQLQNVGSIENKGFEFSLNTVNVEKKDFSWNSTLSISTNKSEVLELDGREYIDLQSTGNQGGTSARLIVGESMPVFIGLNYLGTYKTEEEIIADGREGMSFIGGPRFENLDDNPTWNDEDATIIGSPEPDFYGGFRNTFTYKNLSLDVFFQGQYGSDIFNIRTQTSFYGRNEENLDSRVLDRWIEGENETSDIPRAGVSSSLFNPNSSVNIEDGSFLRLKTATLNYNLPLEQLGWNNTFSTFNVYVTGTNLFLLSKFKLGDPETSNFSSDSGFSSVSQGFAAGTYPYAKSITLGLKMEF
ncbi:TonB-dependent receptor [Lutibacter sp. A80]|uniref:SusC/RagA family TonB-linked outer membrane protein n=1 Tax=Lutibacter sp. A80 TaxID=2918453 RepID=UPI001F056F1B|nr:TonB-dependent receptor [Lutibacter sp. A80]UMB62048.1 TonB-dependent receptor [Lutibacter sp. A80]